MNPLFAAAAEIEDLCRASSLQFCLIGGLAVLRWGEPRLTRDVDITVLSLDGSEPHVIDVLLDGLQPRLDDARTFALENRVLLLKASNGIPIDVALGALDFEARATQRASPWDTGETSLTTCSGEDLIVHKVFAGRDRDWLDVEGILARQGNTLDWELSLNELTPLLALKDSPTDAERLRTLIQHLA